MNVVLKRLVRQQYNDDVRCILQDNVLSDGFKPGDKVPIQRETLIDFVEKVYDKINNENIRKRWIAQAFDKCGLNPWGDDTCSLKHLDQLNEIDMYKALTEAYTAEVLDWRV